MQDIPLHEGDRALPLVAETGRRLSGFADRHAFIGWGLRDFVFDRHFLAGFRDDLPRAPVMAFAAAGHYLLNEARTSHNAGKCASTRRFRWSPIAKTKSITTNIY